MGTLTGDCLIRVERNWFSTIVFSVWMAVVYLWGTNSAKIVAIVLTTCYGTAYSEQFSPEFVAIEDCIIPSFTMTLTVDTLILRVPYTTIFIVYHLREVECLPLQL